MRYTVLIPAAGSGKRMQSPVNKVLLELGGKTVLEHTVSIFEQDEDCVGIYVAAKEEELETFHNILANTNKLKKIVIGGEERQDSIQNMLINASTDYVMVHDAARPFVEDVVLNSLKEALKHSNAVICGVTPKDTVKRVNDRHVQETISRDTLLLVHTPQAFKRETLLNAYEHAHTYQLQVTDDAMMVEAIGVEVSTVVSSYTNIKITTQEDLLFAETILNNEV